MAIPIAFLYALQASGMVVDYFGKQDQIRMSRIGAQIEQAGINSNIASSRLESEEGSLQSMRQLRQNLGTQAAMLAARGVRAGAGTAALFGNESIGNFNADERIRKINQLGNEANLRAGKLMSQFHEKTYENKTWNEFKNSIVDKISTNPSSYGFTKVGS